MSARARTSRGWYWLIRWATGSYGLEGPRIRRCGMTPARAGLKPAEPPSQGETDQEGKKEQRCEKVVHPILGSLRRIPEENGPKRQGCADAEQRGQARGGVGRFANEIGH